MRALSVSNAWHLFLCAGVSIVSIGKPFLLMQACFLKGVKSAYLNLERATFVISSIVVHMEKTKFFSLESDVSNEELLGMATTVPITMRW